MEVTSTLRNEYLERCRYSDPGQGEGEELYSLVILNPPKADEESPL